MTISSLSTMILAAGKGTRMKSALPKVLHPIAGQPMINRIIATAEQLNPQKIVVVTAPGMNQVETAVAPHSIAIQEKQLGTGDAVKAGMASLESETGNILILLGDGPLYTQKTLSAFLAAFTKSGCALGFLGMTPADPTGYGRLVTNNAGQVTAIVEEKEASEDQKKIGTCWTGVMVAKADKLRRWLPLIDNNNSKGEYYLTRLADIASAQGEPSMTSNAPLEETLGANSRAELAALEEKVQTMLRHKAMENGATLLDPKTTYFSHDTLIGQDVVIEPGVFFGPGVIIGDNVTIHAFSHIEGVTIERGASIGPFARIRPKSHIGENATVGNFVEVNRATLKAGAKSKHVSYLGDAVIGEKSNIGAGTVIANYDGFNKQKTTIGASVFVGSNSTIVAPCTIEDGAIIGAGSVVTENVPSDALYLERSAPDIREGAAHEYRQKKGKK